MNNKVFKFFEEISAIPRGSGNMKEISEYCVSFANERGLRAKKDNVGNVIIWKNGSAGREEESPVIIQGHLDMVAEKNNDSDHDFKKDGLKLVYDNDYVYAKDTTLGGDDGIAIAYALAILDDNTLSHPPIEAVFTVDEEIGMLGAAVLDVSELKGKYMLNIDSEEEGSILVSCAGGMTSICKLPVTKTVMTGRKYELIITGLKGGHSGTEIYKERANAVIEMGRVLRRIYDKTGFKIVSVDGGLKDNAIPRECKAEIVILAEKDKNIDKIVNTLNVELSNEYQAADENINLQIKDMGLCNEKVLDSDTTKKVILFLNTVPNGVCHMSKNVENLVETSLNLGVFKVDLKDMIAKFSVRSSVASRKETLGMKLRVIIEHLGGEYEVNGNYPAWEYKKDSILREKMINIYERMYGKKLKVEAIHAGLECGYFVSAKPDIDVVSFGPDIYDIHTTEEKMKISSVHRIYDYIIEILKEI